MPMHSGQGQGAALHHRSVQQQQGHSSPRSKQLSPRSSFLYNNNSNNNSAGGSGVGGGGGNTPHQLGAMNHAARMELQLMEADSSLEMGIQLGQMNEYEYDNRAFSLINHQQQMRQSMPVYYQPQQQQEQLYSQQLLRGMNTHREHDMARDFAAAKGQQNNFFTPSQSNSYAFPFEQQQQQSYAFNGSDGGYPLSSSQLSGNSFSFGLGGGSGSSLLSTDLGFGLPPVVSDSSSAATSLMSGLREGTVEFPDRRNQRPNAPSSQHNFSNSSNKNLF